MSRLRPSRRDSHKARKLQYACVHKQEFQLVACTRSYDMCSMRLLAVPSGLSASSEKRGAVIVS